MDEATPKECSFKTKCTIFIISMVVFLIVFPLIHIYLSEFPPQIFFFEKLKYCYVLSSTIGNYVVIIVSSLFFSFTLTIWITEDIKKRGCSWNITWFLVFVSLVTVIDNTTPHLHEYKKNLYHFDSLIFASSIIILYIVLFIFKLKKEI